MSVERIFYAPVMKTKSGFYLYVPKSIAEGAGILDRDEVEVRIIKTGKTRPKSERGKAGLAKRVAESSAYKELKEKNEVKEVEKEEVENMSTAEKAVKGIIHED